MVESINFINTEESKRENVTESQDANLGISITDMRIEKNAEVAEVMRYLNSSQNQARGNV